MGIFGVLREKRMLKDRYFLVLAFLAVICSSLPTWAQSVTTEPLINSANVVRTKLLFSSSVGRRFYEIAHELAVSEDITGPETEQAMIFLNAVKSLDNNATYVQPLLIKLACRHSTQDYSEHVYRLLVNYVDESADLEVVREAIKYLLERLNSREERENFLKDMLAQVGGRNSVLASELNTLLGLLMLEKTDSEAATFYFIRAYNNNRYNRLAFAKLAEIVSGRVRPTMYLEHFRLVVRENPLDIEAALGIAQYAEQLQLYEMAADAYKYCAGLFSYLYSSEVLPPRIYLPWAVNNYNIEGSQGECLRIAEDVRKTGRFDILLESIVGRAAVKMGDVEKAARIYRSAEEKALQFIERSPGNGEVPSATTGGSQPQYVGAERLLAWFYCFASPDAAKALDWANKAYSNEPNSTATSAILAYALVMNGQLEWAKPLVKNYERNQIAELALAQIQLAAGQNDVAIETLKSAISKHPGSLVAERAKEILVQQGREYVPPVDPEVVLTVIRNSFGRALVPEFLTPDKIISARFDIRSDKFSYGSEFNAVVAIMNNSSEPLVISDDGLFRGKIRVDASVSGDLNKKIPSLVSRNVRTTLLVEPGRGILTDVSLFTGELRQMLLSHPQASLDIEFTLYLDPVTTDEGKVTNRLVDIKPVKVVVKRPGIELTGEYLRNRFNSISTGKPNQKIKTAQLFVGLLKEQSTMADQGTLYRFKYADWIPGLLRSGLLHESGLLLNRANGEWVVKVHTMAEMLSLPLDQELIDAVAKNLKNANWPVRMMVIYLLAKSPDAKFGGVLNWAAENDSNEFVRSMAKALAAAKPQASESDYLQPRGQGEGLSLLRSR